MSHTGDLIRRTGATCLGADPRGPDGRAARPRVDVRDRHPGPGAGRPPTIVLLHALGVHRAADPGTSITHISQSAAGAVEREAARWPARRSSSAYPPGVGSASRCTCRSMSNCVSRTQTGWSSPSGTRRSLRVNVRDVADPRLDAVAHARRRSSRSGIVDGSSTISAAHVHQLRGRLEVEEARVEPRQPVHAAHPPSATCPRAASTSVTPERHVVTSMPEVTCHSRARPSARRSVWRMSFLRRQARHRRPDRQRHPAAARLPGRRPGVLRRLAHRRAGAAPARAHRRRRRGPAGRQAAATAVGLALAARQRRRARLPDPAEPQAHASRPRTRSTRRLGADYVEQLDAQPTPAELRDAVAPLVNPFRTSAGRRAVQVERNIAYTDAGRRGLARHLPPADERPRATPRCCCRCTAAAGRSARRTSRACR